MQKAFSAIGLIGTVLVLIAACAPANIVGGPISPDRLQAGIYEGQAKTGPVKVVAKVTIQKRRITDIELLEHRNWKGSAAEKVISDRIIAEQSTKVDAVSGATFSSRAIMNAVDAAVRQAQGQDP